MATWLETTHVTLRAAGLRAGGARAAVLDALSRQDCCVTVRELHDTLRAEGRSVGIATVYRVLHTLSELRLLQRVDLGDGVTRFEPMMRDRHHHVVCAGCGKVEPFTDATLERAIAGVSGRVGYAVAAHEVVLRGACRDCRDG